MKKLIFVLLVVAVTVIVSAESNLGAEKPIAVDDSPEDISNDIAIGDTSNTSNRGVIISSVVKKSIKQMLDQMPCGWPERGIPPLAPYRNEQVDIEAERSFVKTITQLLRLRVDGLDDVKIKKLSVSYINKKVKFHFIFRKIQATSLFRTDTLVDLMNELGLTVRYEGGGDLDFNLHKLSINGSFKYKLPLIFGSAKIYKFEAVVTLGDCISNINGLAPTSKANRYINDQIEDLVLSGINDNQDEISARIEEAVVPTVNEALKGKNVWDVIAMKPSKPEKCIPPPDPWA